ncbi:MAG: tetratricopeptide repeat protein [Planctomycetota bacterium]
MIQDPASTTPVTAAAEEDPLGSLLDFLTDPRVLEVAAIAAILTLVLWLLLSLRRSIRSLHGRRQLVSYLDGLEALLSGDPERAKKRLAPVVEADPENLGARLALGEALYALDRPAEAHRQHFEAQQVFQAEGPTMLLSLARDLRKAGEHGEALDHLDRALDKKPRDEVLLEESWSLREEMGRYEEAYEAGARLLPRSDDQARRRRLAQTAALAGQCRLVDGDRGQARRWFRRSLELDPDNLCARRGRLLCEPELALSGLEQDATALPATTGAAAALPAPLATAERLLALCPEAVCPSCGAERELGDERPCPACAAATPPRFVVAGSTAVLDDPQALCDEIEESDAWFERLAARAATGDEDAREDLVDAGGRALCQLLTVWLDLRDERGKQRLELLLVELGTRHVEELLAARKALRERRNRVLDLLAGARNLDRELGRVFRGLGWEALPRFERLLEEGEGLADPGLRGLVIDYFLGLGDLQVFEKLAPRYSPVEIVRHLNQVPPQDLVPLFRKLPEGPSFLRDALLLDPNLDQDRALVEAYAACEDEAAPRFEELFAELGPSRDLWTGLVGLLDRDEPARGRAATLLALHASASVRYLVPPFVDPERDEGTLARLADLLRLAGGACVHELVRAFGSSPSRVDQRCIGLLASLGPTAVPALVQAYATHLTLLGKLQSALFRGRHPRACLVEALARVPGPEAEAALVQLQGRESDADLGSRIAEALRRRRAGT